MTNNHTGTSYIKHLAINRLLSVLVLIKSTCNLTGNCFELPNVSYTRHLSGNCMTAEQFEIFWSSTYNDTIPIFHYFRYDFYDRWFRIHSLPESKNYAENETDWNILLDRQNKIITDIIGENSKIIIVSLLRKVHYPPTPWKGALATNCILNHCKFWL
jgi:hypothetical protein